MPFKDHGHTPHSAHQGTDHVSNQIAQQPSDESPHTRSVCCAVQIAIETSNHKPYPQPIAVAHTQSHGCAHTISDAITDSHADVRPNEESDIQPQTRADCKSNA